MKPNYSQVVHSVGTETESVRMTLDQNSVVHLMSVLTNLYSDTILAFVREYSTNAHDSHVEAGVSDPIEVTLPSPMNPNFTVEDRGVGLSVDDIRDVYSMYGRSTKRESDDVTGTLGLGCKSGLTYALSFTVVGIKNGVQTTALVTKDHDGVGMIKILDTRATEGPNGVKVSIPVAGSDVERVCRTARDFFRYWKPGTVLVNGEPPGEWKDAIWLDEDVCILPESSGWHHLVMGNVPYRFSGYEAGVDFPRGYTVVAWIPMGSVNFTPSRETLHFTPLTTSTIKTVQEFVEERLIATIMKWVDEAESAYAAIRIQLQWWHIIRHKLRAQVKNMDLLPDHRLAWELRRGSARKVEPLRLDHLIGDFHVVLNFPFKSVSPKHKWRFEEYGIERALILPDGTDTRYLQGREGLVEWDDIVAATPDPPKGQRAPNGTHNKTLYTIYHNGGTYRAETISNGSAVYDYVSYGHPTHQSRLHLFPEVHVACLTQNQRNRFVRLHPGAISFQDYQAKKVQEAKKKLTAQDKLLLSWGPYDRDVFKRLNPDLIEDPELALAVRSLKSKLSPAGEQFKALGQSVEGDSPESKFYERYPLLRQRHHYSSQYHPEDLILYVNAKWQHLNNQGETE